MTEWIERNRITQVKFDAKSSAILWLELFLFAVLYGLAFRSSLVFGIILLGLAILMYMPKRTVYIIIALSFLWGFIAFSIDHSIRWGLASGLGMVFFLFGLRAHATGLKKPAITRLFPLFTKIMSGEGTAIKGDRI